MHMALEPKEHLVAVPSRHFRDAGDIVQRTVMIGDGAIRRRRVASVVMFMINALTVVYRIPQVAVLTSAKSRISTELFNV